MAGLQYNFFPTDFLYPKLKKPLAADATRSLVKVPAEIQKTDVENNLEQPKITADIGHNLSLREKKLLKAKSGPRKNDDYGRRYLKYLSPYPVSWVLWIEEEPSEMT
ncbi:hypothetical protein L484_015526 [Morus notabilis]|uniref:Uncharacterized protein n=1 Tax=Morus notabilis TaxID=981085 RepID=W9RS37_9ROSA|nr:hypothetical protein L484_015526 [Morus notabilis]